MWNLLIFREKGVHKIASNNDETLNLKMIREINLYVLRYVELVVHDLILLLKDVV